MIINCVVNMITLLTCRFWKHQASWPRAQPVAKGTSSNKNLPSLMLQLVGVAEGDRYPYTLAIPFCPMYFFDSLPLLIPKQSNLPWHEIMYLVPNMKVCLPVLFFNLVISFYLLWIAFKAFPLRFLVVFNEYGWGFRLQWFIDFPRVGFYVPNIKLCFELLWLSSTWKNSSMSRWVGMAVDIPQKHLFTNIIVVSANSASSKG